QARQRPRERAQGGQPQVPAALPARGAAAARARPYAGRVHPRRDGRALGRSEGGGAQAGVTRRGERFALLGVLLLAAALRLPALDVLPNGLIPDEALTGYDAYSIA